MSKAFKCDRCNRCFDPLSIRNGDFFVTMPELYFQTGVDYKKNTCMDRKDTVHLCPECAFIFKTFMENSQAQLIYDGRSDDYDRGYLDGLKGFGQNPGKDGCVFTRVVVSDVGDTYSGSFGGTDSAGTYGSDKTPERKKRSKEDREH